jgi:putative radical SAM enzyme (TIGR03279 family)
MTESVRTARERANGGGVIDVVRAGSLADKVGLRAGDRVIAIDGHTLNDAVDFQFYAAEERIALEAARGDEQLTFQIDKHPDEDLGIDFQAAAFDGIKACNNACFFCFLKGNPRGMRKTLYVKDDDYRLSFFHGNFVTLTNLSDSDWTRIEEQRLSPINVSVHATEPELRRYMLGNKSAPDICKQLRRLGTLGIRANTQIVLCPGVNDGAALDRSISDLSSLHPTVQTISIVPVGATMTAEERIDRGAHSQEIEGCTPEFARSIIEQIGAQQRRFRKQHGRTLVYLADEYYIAAGVEPPSSSHYDGFEQYENGIGMTRWLLDDWRDQRRRHARRSMRSPAKQAAGGIGKQGLVRGNTALLAPGDRGGAPAVRKLTFVCGTLIAPTLTRIAAEFSDATGIDARVHAVENRYFGPRVNVSGLLVATDLERELRGADLGDLAVLPRYALDYTGTRFLDDATPAELQRTLGVPLAFASSMRDVLQILEEPLESEVAGAGAGATTNGKSWVDYSELSR